MMNKLQCVLGTFAIGLVAYIAITFAEQKSENKVFLKICAYKLPIVLVACLSIFFLALKMLPSAN